MNSSTPQDHAKFSPSAAHRWMSCSGSIPLTAHLPRTTNDYADEGTAAHELAAWCLSTGRDPWDFEMYEMNIYNGKCTTDIANRTEVPKDFTTHSMWVVDQAMIEYVTDFINTVQDYRTPGDMLLVEQRLEFSEVVGEEEQFGTGDVVLIGQDEITIIDLKYGRGVVVHADRNKQLMIYALAAYSTYNLLRNFTKIRLVISQPRVNHLSEYTLTVEELLAFGEEVGQAAERVREASDALTDGPKVPEKFLNPGEEQCRFCEAKTYCPAVSKKVFLTVSQGDFEDLTDHEHIEEKLQEGVVRLKDSDTEFLSFAMTQVDLIEGWCKAVRGAVFDHLNSGDDVPGFKLVRGRKGNRRWVSEEEAEKVLVKSMKLKHDVAYSKKLISPTQALKILKESPQRTKRIESLITQSEGALSVAPEDDKRPAETPISVEFEDLTGDLV